MLFFNLRDNHGADLALDGLIDLVEGGDDGGVASGADKVDAGLDLGAHGALGELAGLEELLGLGDGHAGDALALLGVAEVLVRAVDVGEDDEHVRVDEGAEDGGGEVLVDDGLDARDDALLVTHHRDATAAGRDDDDAVVNEVLDCGTLNDLNGLQKI